MHVRIVTFTGAQDIDGGITYVREKVLPLLSAQKGYRGMTASADRAGGVLAVMSTWETAADRDATDDLAAQSRQEAAAIVGVEPTVERFELVVSELGETPPMPGSALLVTRFRMDPARLDDNVAFFASNVVPHIKADAGFLAVRQMINRETGEGVVGTVWADEGARKLAVDGALGRRPEAEERGVTLGEMSFREIVFADVR